MEVKVAICDDVKEVCTNLEDMLVKAFETTGKKCEIDIFYTGEAFCREFVPQKYEMVFLDIELTGMDGLEVSRYIREEKGDEYTQIVYISGKTEYVMELFEHHPLYFLKKPFKKEKIQWVVEKYQKIVKQDDKLFRYKIGRQSYGIPLWNIVYFKAEKRKIILYTHNMHQKEISFYGSMRQIYASVKENKFLWIHQCLVVNFHYIKQATYDKILLLDGTILQISQSRRPAVRAQMEEYLEEK